LKVEVEYGEEHVALCGIGTARVDETDTGFKHERGTRFSGDLETRAVVSIVLLDPRAGDR